MLALVAVGGLLATTHQSVEASSAACSRAADEATPVLLSELISSNKDALRQSAGTGDIPLVIDVQTLSLSDAHEVLYSLQDSRDSGRPVVAVVPGKIAEGCAVVAAGCQGMVLLPEGELSGCSDAWCPSPSRCSAMAEQVAELGDRERAVVDRLLGGTAALSYPTASGAKSGTKGRLTLAQQGKPMELNATALQILGWAERPYADRVSALAAIVAGKVPTAQQGAATGAGAGGAPAVPPPGGAAAAPPIGALMPRAATKLNDINSDLQALKKDIERFHPYYLGDEGVWDQKSHGLREVWDTGEMTKHQATKQICKDLQVSMLEKAVAIKRNAISFAATAKGGPNPYKDQLKELEKLMIPFEGALRENDPKKYERSREAILATKIK